MKTGRPDPKRNENFSPDKRARRAERDALNLRRDLLKGFGVEDTEVQPLRGGAGGFNKKSLLGG